MIEHFQDKLHQEECKQWKDTKICASFRRKPEYEKCSKAFCQIFASQNMQNQTNAKHSIKACVRYFLSNFYFFYQTMAL